jgi:hypothetical protein
MSNKQFYPHVVLAVSGDGATSFAFVTGSSKKGYVYLTKFIELEDVVTAFYLYGVRNMIPFPSNPFTVKSTYESFPATDSASRFKDRDFVCARWSVFIDLLNKRWDKKFPDRRGLMSSLVGWFVQNFLDNIKLGFMGHEISTDPFLPYERFRRLKIATITDTDALVAVLDMMFARTHGLAKNCFLRATSIERRQRRRGALLASVRGLDRDHKWTMGRHVTDRSDSSLLSPNETAYLLDMLEDGVDLSKGEEFNRFRRMRNLRDAKERLINHVPGNELLDSWTDAYIHSK